MSSEDVERAYNLDTDGLWNEISMLFHNGELEQAIYEDCKYGIYSKENIFFDIRIYIEHKEDEKYVKLRPKTKEITINKKRHKYQDFLDELERRESIMRNILITYYGEKENDTVGRWKTNLKKIWTKN